MSGVRSLDIGDLCVDCGQDTAPGSGRFVNRYPAESIGVVSTFDVSNAFEVLLDGYRCPDCQIEEVE